MEFTEKEDFKEICKFIKELELNFYHFKMLYYLAKMGDDIHLETHFGIWKKDNLHNHKNARKDPTYEAENVDYVVNFS